MKQEKKLFKHQTAITVIAVIITVTVAIGSSYLLFNRQDDNKEYNAFKEEDFEISYVDNGKGNGDVLSLVDATPMSDEEGSSQQPYRFNVTNTGEEKAKFVIKLSSDQALIDEDDCETKQLSTYYIKYKIDNQEPKILSTVETKDYEIYVSNNELMPGSSEIHELRIWLVENSPESVKSNHFHGRLEIEQITEEKTWQEFQVGEAVTLPNGDKYHVIETSDNTMSKVKLLSDYNLIPTGVQDNSCVISEFIQGKINEGKITDQAETYYCSTGKYQELGTTLYQNYFTNLKKAEIVSNYDEVRLITVPEIEAIANDQVDSATFSTSLKNENIAWLITGNYWTSTPNSNNENSLWAISVDETGASLQEFENTSEYFGIRPVVVIDKDLLQ